MLRSEICVRLFWHWARAAASRTFWTAGRSSTIRIAMIAITTNNSISVNPARRRRRIGASFGTRDERMRRITYESPRAGRLSLTLLADRSGLRDGEVEHVVHPRLDLHLLG